MQQYTRIVALPLAAAVVMSASALVSGCKGGNSDTSAASDTTLQMAGRDSAQPKLHDVGTSQSETHRRRRATTSSSGAETTATGAAASAAAPARVTGSVPAGTTIDLASAARVCTNTYKVGQSFAASVTAPVAGSNGVSLPVGSTASLHVTQVKPSNNVTQSGQIGVAIDSINVNNVSTPLDGVIASAATEKVRATQTSQQLTKVGIGAAAGAILGQVIGKNTKSTLIGAGAGAAAGGGAAYATTKYDFCIPQNGKIVIKLDSALPVTQ